MNGSRLPRSPGGRGARGGPEAQGPAGTMAGPGPAVAEAGAAADGEGWGTGAKLGTKGPFSRPAGGCLHRCGSGGAAPPRAGGRGAASAAPGRRGGRCQGWAPLISRAPGAHPHTSSRLRTACARMGPAPGPAPPRSSPPLPAPRPAGARLAWAYGGTGARADGGRNPGFPQPRVGSLERPGTLEAPRKHTDSPTSGALSVYSASRAWNTDTAGACVRPGGLPGGFLPHLDGLGRVSFLEEVREPQGRARPTFSGRKRLGTDTARAGDGAGPEASPHPVKARALSSAPPRSARTSAAAPPAPRGSPPHAAALSLKQGSVSTAVSLTPAPGPVGGPPGHWLLTPQSTLKEGAPYPTESWGVWGPGPWPTPLSLPTARVCPGPPRGLVRADPGPGSTCNQVPGTPLPSKPGCGWRVWSGVPFMP